MARKKSKTVAARKAAARPSAAKLTKARPKSPASAKRKSASAAAAVMERAPAEAKKYVLGSSKIFTPEVMNDIHIKSELGRYRMRGFSLFKKIPHWDDLTFLPGTLTRFVIEGYREKCETRTVIGPRAKRPMVLDIPVYVTGMSFGALSYEAKIALARGATMAGSATCSGEGGMIPDERRYSERWFYQCIQSRYGFNPHHLRIADGCEFFIGQGCKVGLGGHLMGQKVTDQVAEMRSLPAGIDQRSPARHPDWLGPDDLALKIEEIREATNHEIPIQLKLGAARVYDDVRMAVKCGPDSIYIDAMEGGTGAGPHIAAEDTGIPGIAAIREARRAIDELGKRNEISLVYAGGIRNGGDVAKAMALGADAIAIGHSVLMALNCNKHIEGVTDYPNEIGVEAGYCYHCHTGRCPVGVATQDPLLRQRLDPDKAAERVYNFLHTLTMEAQLLARACGKTNIHSLEPEDLAALTMEASAMCKVPLAGTNYTVGMENGDYHKY
jgi:glutamate synthase domain-containing protein 2